MRRDRHAGPAFVAVTVALGVASGVACSSSGPHDIAPVDAAIDAPPAAAPDLRFKWVEPGAQVVFGNAGEIDSTSAGGSSQLIENDGNFGPFTVTPLEMQTQGLGSNYAWQFGTFTESRSIEPIYGVATAGAIADLDTSLATDLGKANAGVIVSLDVEPGAFAYVVQGAMTTAYTSVGSDVGSAALDGFVAAAGSAGEVITALSASPTAGLLRVYAHGKAGDTTAYQTTVVHSTEATFVDDVTTLAGSGFIVTAVGHVGDDAVVLVGTRGPNASYAVTEQTDEFGPTGVGSGAVVGWLAVPTAMGTGSGSGSGSGSVGSLANQIMLEQ